MPNDTFTPEQIAQILEEFFKVVGTRQYVGARYVPIFGRKGEDSIEWDNSGTYEPLSVVLYQGNSYTSRQFVPVGVEITNQQFWANTGNYNAQVEQYRQETAAAKAAADAAQKSADNAQNDIDTLLPKTDFSSENTVKDYVDGAVQRLQQSIANVNSTFSNVLPLSAFSTEDTVKAAIDSVRTDIGNVLPLSQFSSTNTIANAIDAAEGKNIVAIGDSYGEGYTPDGNVTSWIKFFKDAIETYDYTVFSNALGGAGFWREESKKKFATLIAELAGTMSATEKANVGAVVIGGGYNDHGNTAENITLGMADAKTAIQSNFPNCKRVLIFPFGMAVQGLTSADHAGFQYSYVVEMVRNYVSCNADTHLGTVVGNANMLLRRNAYFSSDFVHPNRNGQFLLGSFVTDVFFGNANSLMAGRYNSNYVPNIVLNSGVSSQTIFQLDSIDGFFVAKKTGTNTITFTNPINFTFDNEHPIKIGTFADAALQRYGYIRIPITMLIRSTTSTPKKYSEVNGALEIVDGVLQFNSYAANSAGTNFLTIESIDRIQYFVYEQQINGLLLV